MGQDSLLGSRGLGTENRTLNYPRRRSVAGWLGQNMANPLIHATPLNPSMPDHSPPPTVRPEQALLAIVTHTVADRVQRALLADGFRVTRINTAGGFLRRGNVTFLAGVQAGDVDRAIERMRMHVGDQGGWVMVADLATLTSV